MRLTSFSFNGFCLECIMKQALDNYMDLDTFRRMKKIFYFIFLVLISCGQQKPSELTVADAVKKDSVIITAVSDSLPPSVSPDPEPKVIFDATIRVEDNAILAGLANYPFIKELDAMKGTLDSVGVTADYQNGENGSLTYDSVEISFNRSYGESICEADIRSRQLVLNNGMTIGIALDDFLNLTGIKSTANAQSVRFEYRYTAQEHAYIMHFDFLNKTLIRFYYQKSPCVIYD
jgi:hypothetical protein